MSQPRLQHHSSRVNSIAGSANGNIPQSPIDGNGNDYHYQGDNHHQVYDPNAWALVPYVPPLPPQRERWWWSRIENISTRVWLQLWYFVRTYPALCMLFLGAVCSILLDSSLNHNRSSVLDNHDIATSSDPGFAARIAANFHGGTITITQTETSIVTHSSTLPSLSSSSSQLPPFLDEAKIEGPQGRTKELKNDPNSSDSLDTFDATLTREICEIYTALVVSSSMTAGQIFDRELFEYLDLPCPGHSDASICTPCVLSNDESDAVYTWEAIQDGLVRMRANLGLGYSNSGFARQERDRAERILEGGILYQIAVLLDDRVKRKAYVRIFLCGVSTARDERAARVVRVCRGAGLFSPAQGRQCA